jgi:FdhE protein
MIVHPLQATTAGTALQDLRRRRQEWAPWLAVVERVLRETGGKTWDAAVPACPAEARSANTPSGTEARSAKVPLLACADVSLDARSVRHFLAGLIRIAAREGTSKMVSLQSTMDAELDVCALFAASLCQDEAHVRDVAAGAGVDADALQAVVALLPVPFLHACRRRWASSVPQDWTEGYCPICGTWAAFAEVRGIERSRYLRCGRCGGEWRAHMLCCPYCATNDHDELVALAAENAGSSAAIEACRRCLGYVKTFTRLQGCAPDTVMIEDLASVELDIAALEQGYARPAAAACSLDLRVSDKGTARRFFAWKT